MVEIRIFLPAGDCDSPPPPPPPSLAVEIFPPKPVHNKMSVTTRPTVSVGFSLLDRK